MNENAIFFKAVELWGKQLQFDIAVEELAELTKAIVKYKRFGGAEECKNLIEEIVDVDIMLSQLRFIFKIDENVFVSIRELKIKRLEAMITAQST